MMRNKAKKQNGMQKNARNKEYKTKSDYLLRPNQHKMNLKTQQGLRGLPLFDGSPPLFLPR